MIEYEFYSAKVSKCAFNEGAIRTWFIGIYVYLTQKLVREKCYLQGSKLKRGKDLFGVNSQFS